MLQPYIEWTPTTTTYMLTHIFIPPFSVQASCLHASADFIHHLVVLLVAATVGRSRSWRSARLTGAGSGWGWRGWRGWRTSSRSGTTTTCGSSSDSSGGGTATWGATREEVLAHIGEMAGMIVERLAEEGASVPAAPADQEPSAGERIVVTVCVPLEEAPHPA